MPEQDGVVVYRTTRITMIEALQQLPVQPQPEPEPCRRRHMPLSRTPAVTPPAPHRVTCPLDVADLADAILLNLPEAEPAPLKAIAEAERVIAAKDETIADLRGAVDDAAAASHDIDLILDGVPCLSQDHPGQAGAVAELAERCKSAEAKAARSGEIADGLRGRRAKLVRELADVTVRADRAEQELARVAAALAPLTVTTGMTHAERTLAAGVIRDSISLPAPARPEGLTVHACQVDATAADPYQGLGSGGMIP